MPELPDVQVFKEYLDATVLHRRVEQASVRARRELRGVSARALAARLRGHSLERTRRHGKHLFVELGGGPRRWLRLHFGMTGFLRAWQGGDDAPDGTRLDLSLDGGWRLAWVCQRRFGEIGCVQDPDAFIERERLGPDPWRAMALADFRRCLEGRRGGVKSTLMNQQVLAGLGNVYSDEILFQAGIHPDTAVPALGPGDLRRIWRVTERVLQRAVAARADPRRMPRAWLTPRREAGRACPRCGGTIERIDVGGRSAYFCPGHQQPPG